MFSSGRVWGVLQVGCSLARLSKPEHSILPRMSKPEHSRVAKVEVEDLSLYDGAVVWLFGEQPQSYALEAGC
jgi:hypothetical protein